MTAINFPDSPSNGDTHTVGGVTYTYNSAETKWKTTINSNAFLPLTGGTVSGNILMGGEIQHDGDTDTNIAFDTDTILFDTAGSERFRVGSAGQLGIGGATYGTSGQVLTSQGSASAPQWASPSGVIVKGSSVSFNGSTDVEFTGIGSNVCRIIFAVDEISSNNTDAITLELGHSGGYTTSGYVAWVKRMGGSSFNTGSQLTSAFDLTGTNAAAETYSGVIELLNGNGNSWVCNSNIQGSADNRKLAGGRVTVGGTLTKLKFDVGGATFDAGHVRMYTFTEA